MTVFNIQVISDVICPWCFVGKRRMEKAIDLYRKTFPTAKDDTFNITWKPFYLNPDVNSGSEHVLEVLNRKMGPDRVPMMMARLKQVGQQEGIDFKFNGKSGNTRDAHRLIHLSSTRPTSSGSKGSSQGDLHGQVVEKLFKAYFEDGIDIQDVESLTRVGVEAGLDEGEVKKWMKSQQGQKEVDEQVSQARRLFHVTGVPTFLIQDGEYRLDGAQDAQDFLEVFGKVKGAEA